MATYIGDKLISGVYQFQFTTMPTPTAELAGKVAQYIGATTAEYTLGAFYICAWTGTEYKWMAVPSGVAVDNTTIEFDATGKLRLTDLSITFIKLNGDLIAEEIRDTGSSAVKLATENAVRDMLTSNFFKQAAYDMAHPIGEEIIAFASPTVPTGVTATWTAQTAYNGAAIWIDSTQVGTNLDGSLPNITGNIKKQWARLSSTTASGAFSDTSIGTTGNLPSSASENGTYEDIYFDASDSNSVYSASAGANIVRPTSKCAAVYKRTA